MALTIQKTWDCNVYVGNDSKHGQASEVTLPNVSFIMNDYNALGMFGTAQYPNGIEAMDTTIKWTYPDNDAQIALANVFTPVDIMVRSSKTVYDSTGRREEQAIVNYLRGYTKQHQGGAFTPRTDVELESVLSVNYWKQEINGVEIIEVDTENNIYAVNGEDMLADRRANLGI